ncbi:MAG TPA: hypothetical protein VGX51_06435, partial [Solirubrobacteraceae bacterium]|nr:hypothetical protein [Solirubrobacteraceae bacterium]
MKMPEALQELVDSLLYEGYALYPYTPGATKNATPTPFGIVYPPAYAARLSSAHDHLELRCVLHAPADAMLAAEARFLVASGERHQASECRVRLDELPVGALAHGACGARASVAERVPRPDGPPLSVALCVRARTLGDDSYGICLRLENRTPAPGCRERRAALAQSLLSAHPLLCVNAGHFGSPLESGCASVNTYPVLAGEGDRAVLGATIALPDHPQIAPESRGSMFDSTEIEEALLLHVIALSDGEREQIERQDPAVREMVARAAAAGPADVIALHGRVTVKDPVAAAGGDCGAAGSPATARGRFSDAPPAEPEGLADPTRGEPAAEVD